MTKRVSREMIFQRAAWISELSQIEFIPSEEGNGYWTLYRNTGKGKFQSILFGASRLEFFRSLQGAYSILACMEEIKKQRTALKPEEISN
jgi:hypothetical protein